MRVVAERGAERADQGRRRSDPPLDTGTSPSVDPTGPLAVAGSRPPAQHAEEVRAEEDQPSPVLFEAADAVPRALQLVGSIVAPTTLLTGLFAYFGLLYSVSYYRHFGVNYTVLDLPIQGFLILSASTATLPLAVLAATTLLALWIYRLPLEALPSRVRLGLLIELLPVVVTVGVVLLGSVAADALLGIRLFPAGLWEARGLSLSAGVVVIAYSARLWHALGPIRSTAHPRAGAPVALTVGKWMCVSLLFAVGLFWAVGSYAIRMGGQHAQGFTAVLRCAPDVVLYSEKSLDLGHAGVSEERAPRVDGTYGFRYPGLKLVPQAGDRYLLLLPADWAPATRPAILLPRSDAVRLEVVPAVGAGSGAC